MQADSSRPQETASRSTAGGRTEPQGASEEELRAAYDDSPDDDEDDPEADDEDGEDDDEDDDPGPEDQVPPGEFVNVASLKDATPESLIALANSLVQDMKSAQKQADKPVMAPRAVAFFENLSEPESGSAPVDLAMKAAREEQQRQAQAAAQATMQTAGPQPGNNGYEARIAALEQMVKGFEASVNRKLSVLVDALAEEFSKRFGPMAKPAAAAPAGMPDPAMLQAILQMQQGGAPGAQHPNLPTAVGGDQTSQLPVAAGPMGLGGATGALLQTMMAGNPQLAQIVMAFMAAKELGFLGSKPQPVQPQQQQSIQQQIENFMTIAGMVDSIKSKFVQDEQTRALQTTRNLASMARSYRTFLTADQDQQQQQAQSNASFDAFSVEGQPAAPQPEPGQPTGLYTKEVKK